MCAIGLHDALAGARLLAPADSGTFFKAATGGNRRFRA
jgi:hypothetical protein